MRAAYMLAPMQSLGRGSPLFLLILATLMYITSNKSKGHSALSPSSPVSLHSNASSAALGKPAGCPQRLLG